MEKCASSRMPVNKLCEIDTANRFERSPRLFGTVPFNLFTPRSKIAFKINSQGMKK